MEFDLQQATELLAMFGGDDASVTVEERGKKMVAFYTDYPDEGVHELGSAESPPPTVTGPGPGSDQ